MDYRSTIMDTLEFLRKKEVAEKQTFKARAYSVVLKQLQDIPHIRTMNDLASVKGMGEKITQKIQEILDGMDRYSEKKEEMKDVIATTDALLHIYGVGPAKANELVQKGIRSISHLRERVQMEPSLLHEKQHIGLRYYEDLLQRIPWSEMKQHENMLKTLLPLQKYGMTMDVVGSYRRGLPSSGDIDVLLRISRKTSVKDCMQCLQPYLREVLAQGSKKIMAICQLPGGICRRLDILFTPDHEYVYSLLYFTGCDQFNVALRRYCIEKGYRLNEHALTSDTSEEIPPMETEADLFQFLHLQYKTPMERISAESVCPLSKIKYPAP